MWILQEKNTGVGCYALLQGIFPTWESNSHLLHLQHCRQILYHLSQQGSPTILELVAYPLIPVYSLNIYGAPIVCEALGIKKRAKTPVTLKAVTVEQQTDIVRIIEV